MRFRIKSLKILLIIITIFLVYKYFYKIDISVKELANDSNYNFDCDKYCDRKWVHMHRKIYFKNTNQFYLLDQTKFHTFFLAHTPSINFPIYLQLNLNIYLNKNLLTNYKSNKIVVNRPWTVGEYGLGSMAETLDLKPLMKTFNIDLEKPNNDVSISFYYCYFNTNNCSSRPLDLIIKKLRTPEETKSKASIVCTKCLHTKDYEVNHMRFWIHSNKMAGYDRVSICNNSLPNTKEYNRLFKKYSDFIDLEQLDCIPNFLKEYSSYYISNLTQMGTLENQDPISGLRINECYIQNVDKYKYILVVDNDETVLTPMLNKFHTLNHLYNDFSTLNFDTKDRVNSYLSELTCNRFNDNKIDSFLQHLVKVNSINKPLSYNFDQVYFVKQRMIQKFFNKFESIIKNSNASYKYPIRININNIDKLNPSIYGLRDDDDLEAYYHTFEIKNENDLNYTLNLYHFNQYYVRPFLEKHALLINKTCRRYNRAFALTSFSSATNRLFGKTIHNTQSSFELTLHEPVGTEFIKIPYDHGYLSHFRAYFHFNKNKDTKSVRELFIDIGYFKCYFVPMIESFANDEIYL